jgi:hypothetical protein
LPSTGFRFGGAEREATGYLGQDLDDFYRSLQGVEPLSTQSNKLAPPKSEISTGQNQRSEWAGDICQTMELVSSQELHFTVVRTGKGDLAAGRGRDEL